MLYHLGYVSTASHTPSRSDLTALLERARQANHNLGLTGMLVYNDGHFLQVLEGARESVLQVFTRIMDDSRHHCLHQLFEGEIPARNFANWTMGFKSLEGGDLMEFPGIGAATKSLREMAEDHGRARQLLIMLRELGQDTETDALPNLGSP